MAATKRDAEKTRVTVSATLIVKDEEKFLPGCLESLAGKVDEVVIVDTGSQDRSVEIAAAAGARILHHAWAGDFAQARNIGLDAATSDWILYIDADERLSLPNGGTLAAYIDPEAAACLVRFRPKSGYTRYREWRLFRNDARIRFEGRIHESMVRRIEAVAASDGLGILPTTVEINHLGYDGDQSHKHDRNLPLLQASVRDTPDRIYYWYHLAETLAGMGRIDEALVVGQEGLSRALRDPSEKSRADCSLLIQTLIRLKWQRSQPVIDLIVEGLRRFPDDHALQFLKGRALLDQGLAAEALEIATGLLAINPESLVDGLLAFETSLFRERACELAAVASLRMGDREQAGRYFLKASAFAPAERSYAIKAAALCGARAG